MGHEFKPGLAAITTEIYVPQKYGKSPKFLQALETSTLPGSVSNHFDDVLIGFEKISPLLPLQFQTREVYDDLKTRVTTGRRVFGGYSIYDMMGAFRWATRDMTVAIDYDAISCVRITDPVLLNEDAISWRKNRNELKPLLSADAQTFFQAVCRTIFALRQHHNQIPNLEQLLNLEFKTKTHLLTKTRR